MNNELFKFKLDKMGNEVLFLSQNQLEDSVVEKITGIKEIMESTAPAKFVIDGTNFGGVIDKEFYDTALNVVSTSNDPKNVVNYFCDFLFNEVTANVVEGYDAGVVAGKKIVKRRIIFGALAALGGYASYKYFKSDDGKALVQKVKDKIHGESEVKVEDLPIPDDEATIVIDIKDVAKDEEVSEEVTEVEKEEVKEDVGNKDEQ